jgi:hypothetical protein
MMELFANRFLEMASNETRSLTVLEGEANYPIPPGMYLFLEHYCNDKECDCRRVVITVLEQKKKEQLASINMGFDAAGIDAGPFLDPLNPQSEYSPFLINMFTEWVNTDPEYLKRLQRHYVMFREGAENRPYQGKPFPPSGRPNRVVTRTKLYDRLLRKKKKKKKIIKEKQQENRERKPDKTGTGKEVPLKSDDRDIVLTHKGIRHAERILSKFTKVKNSTDRLDQFFKQLKDTVFRDYKIVFAVFHLMNGKYAPNGKDHELSQAYMDSCILLKELLTEIRYSTERNRPWALKAAKQIQCYFAENAFEVRIDARIQADILHALYDSGLELIPELLQKSREVMEHYSRFQLNSGSMDIEKVLNELTDNVSGNPFALYDVLMTQMTTMSVQEQVMLVSVMVKSSNRQMQEMGVLMLLHPEPEVRQQVAVMFENFDDYTLFQPEDLRRIIGMRNWMPSGERSAIDTIIKNMRRARVECAALPAPRPVDTYGSFIDGSGSMGLWLVETAKSKKRSLKKTWHSYSVLMRQASGVHAVWGERNINKKSWKTLIKGITQGAQCIRVNSEYINRLCAHYIEKGLKKGYPPPMLLVYTAEAMGQYWMPKSIDFHKLLVSMVDAAEPRDEHSHHDKMRARNDIWTRNQVLASGWFEDNSEVDELLKEKCPEFPDLTDEDDFLEAIGFIFSNILIKKRTVWAERLILMAIRAFSCQGGHKRLGNAFFIVAQELYSKTPMYEIPLMIAVAELSVKSAIKRAGSM